MSAAKPNFVPRIDLIDTLRAFAIMGVYFVHMLEQYEIYWAHPVKSTIHEVITGFVMGKSFSLLALCFGLSFFILMDRAAKRGEDFSWRFGWRMTVLAGLGYIHGLLYRGDVLQVLAPVGLALIALYRIRNNYMLAVIAVILGLQPWLFYQMTQALNGVAWANQNPNYWGGMSLDVYMTGSLTDVFRANLFEGQVAKWWFFLETGRMNQILGLFILGLILGRIGYFSEPEKFNISRRIALVVLLVASVYIYVNRPALFAAFPVTKATPMGRVCFETIVNGWFDLTVMGVYVIVITEIYQALKGRIIGLLAPAGRMTLTLYVVQSLVWIPIFYGFGLGAYAKISQVQGLWLAAGFFAAQVAFAHIWFRYFLYGPLEWVWRSATYLTLKVPFVRKPA